MIDFLLRGRFEGAILLVGKHAVITSYLADCGDYYSDYSSDYADIYEIELPVGINQTPFEDDDGPLSSQLPEMEEGILDCPGLDEAEC